MIIIIILLLLQTWCCLSFSMWQFCVLIKLSSSLQYSALDHYLIRVKFCRIYIYEKKYIIFFSTYVNFNVKACKFFFTYYFYLLFFVLFSKHRWMFFSVCKYLYEWNANRKCSNKHHHPCRVILPEKMYYYLDGVGVNWLILMYFG